MREWIDSPILSVFDNLSDLCFFVISKIDIESTPIFSKYLIFLVLGIGMMSSPCLRSHAIANCDLVHPFLSARTLNWLTSWAFASRFSSLERGKLFARKSFAPLIDSLVENDPVSNPGPSGEEHTKATPSSRQVSRRLVPDACSISSENGEYSI